MIVSPPHCIGTCKRTVSCGACHGFSFGCFDRHAQLLKPTTRVWCRQLLQLPMSQVTTGSRENSHAGEDSITCEEVTVLLFSCSTPLLVAGGNARGATANVTGSPSGSGRIERGRDLLVCSQKQKCRAVNISPYCPI